MPSTASPISSLSSSPKPRILSHRPYDLTVGPLIADTVAQLSPYPLDGWQRDALDVGMAVERDLTWRAFEVGLMVGRQNGKGDILQARALYEVTIACQLWGPRIVWHTAHELQTSEDAHTRLTALIDMSPTLQRRVAKPINQNGRKGYLFRDGSEIRYRARSKAGGRGLQGDLVIFDEAMFVTAAMLGALMPTLTVRTNPQIWYAMTGLWATSDHAHSIRDRARITSDPDPGLAYIEYSAPETADLANRSVWPLANPAMATGRVTEDFLAKELAALQASDETEFAREVLCISESTAGARVIGEEVWTSLADRNSHPAGPVTFALDVDLDRTHAAIGVGGRRSDQRWHIEVAHRAAGTGWIVDWLVERRARHPDVAGDVWLNPTSGAAALIPDLTKAGIPIHAVTPREYTQACGFLYDHTQGAAEADGRDPDVRHLDQAGLNTAVAAGRKRYTTDAWIWHRKDADDDITSLNAVTLALYGAATADAEPAREPPVPSNPADFVDDDLSPMQMRW